MHLAKHTSHYCCHLFFGAQSSGSNDMTTVHLDCAQICSWKKKLNYVLLSAGQRTQTELHIISEKQIWYCSQISGHTKVIKLHLACAQTVSANKMSELNFSCEQSKGHNKITKENLGYVCNIKGRIKLTKLNLGCEHVNGHNTMNKLYRCCTCWCHDPLENWWKPW